MTIKILPARLANQIAAGEVVERPASVVKELVENSLDAGANRIDIDIEKGGAKLIRIRDNGKGIDSEQLSLALSRHATSKIHTLDDLEAIMSLGFRGEALASISSVSRLTLTSRTATQEQACSAYSEGRDMAVKITPAAHPIGTTVEVLDLFFNTPARRKFLRTEKTEFTHIDELLKRIALSRFDVTFNLKHNGKLVRQYRAAKQDNQIEKRLAAICGSSFVRHRLQVELEHQGLKLHGWITDIDGARAQGDIQYCYVNGRMMKDKLINHAIRQSYESALNHDQFAAYVLFIEVDPHQVDVNVHPAKHEVRFHQARLVHDFIYQALAGAIHQSLQVEHQDIERGLAVDVVTNQVELKSTKQDYPNQVQPTSSLSPEPNQSYQTRTPSARAAEARVQETETASWRASDTTRAKTKTAKPQAPQSKSVTAKEREVYSQLLNTEPLPKNEEKASSLGKVHAVVEEIYALIDTNVGCQLISLTRLEWIRLYGQLSVNRDANGATSLKSQPLLIPLSLSINSDNRQTLEKNLSLLASKGIHIQIKGNKALVMAMPQPLREKNLQKLMNQVLHFLNENTVIDEQMLTHFLVNHAFESKSRYTLSEAIQLIAESEQVWVGKLPINDPKLLQPLQLKATIATFEHD